MNLNSLRRRIAGAPMALPLAAVVGSLFAPVGYLAVGLAILTAMVAKAWRVALATLLCAAVCGLHLHLRETRGEQMRALPESGHPALVGTVVRAWENAVILQPSRPAPAAYITGCSGAALGDVLRVRVVEVPPSEAPPVKGMFDREAWLKGLGVGATFAAAGTEKLGHPWSFAAVRGMGLHLRDKLAARVMPSERVSDPRRQVLCALLLGAKDLAEADTLDLFRRGGCLHAFAVSGMHVGIITGFLWVLFRLLWVRPTVARVLLPIVVGVYILVTGCAVSALRAYLMGTAIWGGMVLRRRISLLNTWCTAACLILLCCPYEIHDAGFLLSFAVFAAISMALRLCLRHDAPLFGPDSYIPFRILTKRELGLKKTELYLRGIAVVSLAAWLVSTPVTWACFHTLTPWAFLCNMAIAVPITAAMFCGIALMLFTGIPYLGAAAAWAADTSAGVLLSIVTFFSALPGAYLPATAPQPHDAMAVYELGYGKTCAVLGNPGIVIGAGSPSQARLTAYPALFHAGYTPAAVVTETGKRGESARWLAQQWHGVSLLPTDKPQCLTTPAGRFTLYPPPSELPHTPAENALPVILWEHGGTRTLYVGDASAATMETIPPDERHADTLILGAHPTLPFEDAEDIAAFGAKEVRLLPSARLRRAKIEAEQGNADFPE